MGDDLAPQKAGEMIAAMILRINEWLGEEILQNIKHGLGPEDERYKREEEYRTVSPSHYDIFSNLRNSH